MIKPFIIHDKNKKSVKIKLTLKKKIKVFPFIKSNLIIVIGCYGDGDILLLQAHQMHQPALVSRSSLKYFLP